jgi:hypothetical protein
VQRFFLSTGTHDGEHYLGLAEMGGNWMYMPLVSNVLNPLLLLQFHQPERFAEESSRRKGRGMHSVDLRAHV